MAPGWSLFRSGVSLLRRAGGFRRYEQGGFRSYEQAARGPLLVLQVRLSGGLSGGSDKEGDPKKEEKAKKEEKERASLYFTPASVEGRILPDTVGATTLRDIFDKKVGLCFFNHDSEKGVHDLSKFSKDIFAKLLTVSYQQGVQKLRHFHFDPSTILVWHIGKVVTDVAIPASQLVDPEAKSAYQDRVVGPLAQLVFSICREQDKRNPVIRRKRKYTYCYKEVLDLLYNARRGRWWDSLESLLSHPFFWSIHEMMAALLCMYMWMRQDSHHIPHGVNNIPSRGRLDNFGHEDFIQMFAKFQFFRHNYTFTCDSNGEIDVTFSVNEVRSWKLDFRNEGCFGPKYGFGSGKEMYEFADLLDLCRHVMAHFEDGNFTAYAYMLERPTVKMAMVHLNRRFGLSLSIYYALVAMKVNVKDILDSKIQKFIVTPTSSTS